MALIGPAGHNPGRQSGGAFMRRQSPTPYKYGWQATRAALRRAAPAAPPAQEDARIADVSRHTIPPYIPYPEYPVMGAEDAATYPRSYGSRPIPSPAVEPPAPAAPSARRMDPIDHLRIGSRSNKVDEETARRILRSYAYNPEAPPQRYEVMGLDLMGAMDEADFETKAADSIVASATRDPLADASTKISFDTSGFTPPMDYSEMGPGNPGLSASRRRPIIGSNPMMKEQRMMLLEELLRRRSNESARRQNPRYNQRQNWMGGRR